MSKRPGLARPLPFPSLHQSADAYVDALLSFVTNSETLQTLCGGVHILDFLTKKPDQFASILPQDWRDWLVIVPIPDLLDLLMREDLEPLLASATAQGTLHQWRGYPLPPLSFLQYVQTVRNLSLERSFSTSLQSEPAKLSREICVGMKPKKAHEVVHFAAFVDQLMADVNGSTTHEITHVVDFGSGRNYLGRVLASPLYQRQIIAVESKHLNISGAKHMDISSKLAEKELIWRNKKEYRATGKSNAEHYRRNRTSAAKVSGDAAINDETDAKVPASKDADRIHYIEHRITDGDLHDVFAGVWRSKDRPENGHESQIHKSTSKEACDTQQLETTPLDVMVVSLHSCGNLLHHGLRSLVLNPCVKVVAMVGCCYNLTTERLGPPSVKIPGLRQYSQRIEDCQSAFDPHGFPMSDRLMNHQHRGDNGVRLNITARMMAVQAPQNWTKDASDFFFTRHFYRTLFQKILVDKCYSLSVDQDESEGGQTKDDCPTLGALRKDCYESFVTYVRGAIEKLAGMPAHAEKARILKQELSDEEIDSYWHRHLHKRHQLCIIWSLMAFSAGVIESLIVTDRWLFLREQEPISEAWVQTVFDYGLSPRNLVVVGVKK